jgi:hypothetical protein
LRLGLWQRDWRFGSPSVSDTDDQRRQHSDIQPCDRRFRGGRPWRNERLWKPIVDRVPEFNAPAAQYRSGQCRKFVAFWQRRLWW